MSFATQADVLELTETVAELTKVVEYLQLTMLNSLMASKAQLERIKALEQKVYQLGPHDSIRVDPT